MFVDATAEASYDVSAGNYKASPPVTIETAAKLMKVGRASVDQARHVQRHGVSELQDAVNRGEMKLYTAKDLTRLAKREQIRALKGGPETISRAVKQVRTP